MSALSKIAEHLDLIGVLSGIDIEVYEEEALREILKANDSKWVAVICAYALGKYTR